MEMMALSMGLGLVRAVLQPPAGVGGDGDAFGDAFAGALGGLSQCIYPLILTQHQRPLEEKRQALQREIEAQRLEADARRFERTRELQFELAALSHRYRLAEQQAHFDNLLTMRDWDHFYQHSWPLVVSPVMFRTGESADGAVPRVPLRLFLSNARQGDYRANVEERVVQGLYDFVSVYYPGAGPRPVTFYDGGWRETHRHGGAFIQSLHRVLQGQPTLVIDPMVEGTGGSLTLRASFWGLGEMGIPFERSVFRLPLAAMFRETARAYARRWGEIRSAGSLADTVNPIDAANLKTLEVEEALQQKGLAPAEIEQMPLVQAGYRFDQRHYAAVADAVLVFHALVVGWVADAYYLAEHGLAPLLPEILPRLLHGEPDAELAGLLIGGFRQLYGSLEGRYGAFLDGASGGDVCIPPWCVSPELDLAYARSFAGLPDRSMADERLGHSLRSWLALRGDGGPADLDDPERILDLAVPGDLPYFSALREAYASLQDGAGAARVEALLARANDAGTQYARGERLCEQAPESAAAWYSLAAGQGHADAQYRLGDLYAAGRGLEPDDAQAAAWFEQAAGAGHAGAQYRLGDLYSRGRGVGQDCEQAATWYRKAADQGDARARAALGALYCRGRGVPQDDFAAAAWFRMAAEQGDARAQYDLGRLHRHGRGVLQDDRAAAGWFERAAVQGHADAQAALGRQYYLGLGVDRDYALAERWWRRAAAQGSARAQHNMGFLYRNGQGVEQDLATAREWFGLAADQGFALSQATLGALYRDGEGVEQDFGTAAAWFQKAADQEYAQAQYILGEMYVHGQGVDRNYGRAGDLFLRAAAQGYAPAQNDLAGLYFFGQGTAVDYEQARDWFGKAADQGYVKAYFGLGEIYYYGYGVPADTDAAVAWYVKAAEKDHAGARDRLIAILGDRFREVTGLDLPQ